MRNSVVLINDGRIVAALSGRKQRIPSDYRRVELPGKVVTAGFWNSHVHLTTPVLLQPQRADDEEIQLELRNMFTRWGFTTVIDLASTTEVSSYLRALIDEGRVKGPRLLSVGEPFYPIGGTPIYARPFYETYKLPSAEVSSPAEARKRATRQIDLGAAAIKVFTGAIVGGASSSGVVHLSPEIIRSITTVAHERSRTVFAHPTDEIGVTRAIEGGVDVLAHAAPLMGVWSNRFAKKLAAANVGLVPTLALFADAANSATPVGVAIQQAKALHEAGGKILFGTDIGFTTEFDTRREITLLTSAIGWRGVLASLTENPARMLGEGRQRGRVARGYYADLTVLNADPARDSRAFSDIYLVIKKGEIVWQENGTRPN